LPRVILLVYPGGPETGSAFTAAIHGAGTSGIHFPGQDFFHNMAQGAHNAVVNQFHHGVVHYGQHIPGYQPQGYAMMPPQNPPLPGYDLGYDIIARADAWIGETITNVFLEHVGRYAIHHNP
jgi:hypothetical protein